jgi:hypothetical protein
VDGPSERPPSINPVPRAWVRLHEAPFEGEWIGLSEDYASRLPCSSVDLAWTRLWICLRSPGESALASRLLEAMAKEMGAPTLRITL